MVSVVITTYNGEQYIKEQVESIMNQSIKPDEVLIFDDGSKDNTLNILKDLIIKYPKISLYNNKNNLGYVMNFWNGLKKAKGDFIFLSDQDDVWDPKKIEVMTKAFINHDDMLSLATGYITIDEHGNKKKNFKDIHYLGKGGLRKVTFEQFIKSPRYPGMAMAVRRSLIEDIHNNEEKIIHSHDWFLNLNAALKNGMYFMDYISTYYRQHSTNTYGTNANYPKEKMRERRAEVINDEQSLNQIVSLIVSDDRYRSFIKGQKKAIAERKIAFENGNILKVAISYLKNRKYLALRGLMGDIYVLTR